MKTAAFLISNADMQIREMSQITSATENLAPTLDDLTSEIRFYINAGNSKLISAAADFIEAGKRLIQAKSLLPHGDWQNWLAANFNLSIRTARRYMQVAETAEIISKTDNVVRFQPNSILEIAKLPRSDVGKFLAENPNAADLSVRQLHATVKAWNAAKELAKPTAEKETITIDATPATSAVNAQITPFQSPVVELSLFEGYPALPAAVSDFRPPRELVDAAKKCNAELKIICRAEQPPEISSPSIVVAVGRITSSWIGRLATQATALINSKIAFRLGDEKAAKKNCVILYYGGDTDSFSNAFLEFGLPLFTAIKKLQCPNH